MKRLSLLSLLRPLIVLGCIVGPVVFAVNRQEQTRNFRVVRDGVLYRSGQMSLPALKRIIHDYGIRTVVSLRDAHVAGEPPPDLEEELHCRNEDIRYVRISPKPWWAPQGPPPVSAGVGRFLEVMSDPNNYPVLIHCFAGVHRTGAYCAIYRMEFEGWSNVRALEELRACGYENLDDEWDILSFLEDYRPHRRGTPQEEQTTNHTNNTNKDKKENN